MGDAARWRSLPKPELHLHLEGAASSAVMGELARKYGEQLVEQLGPYHSLDGFLAAWRRRAGLLREHEDFELLAHDVATQMVDAGVRYAELHFSPGAFVRRFGLEPQRIARALRRGFAAIESSTLDVALIVDLVRDHGPEFGERMLACASEVRIEAGIVAVGLGGSEHLVPASVYEGLFRRARALNFHTVAHAGEAAGPESVRAAIEGLQVDRIGHGTSAVADPAVLELVRRRGIAIEVCLTSNLHTGAITALEHHPLPQLIAAGIDVVLSTDDPALFQTDINSELALASELLGSDELVARCIHDGFVHSFAPPEQRERLLDHFNRAWEQRS